MIYPTGRPSAHLADACQQRSKAQAGNARSRHELWEGFVFSQTLSTKENDVDRCLNETRGKSGTVEFQLLKLEDSNKSPLCFRRGKGLDQTENEVLEQYLVSYTSYIGVSKIWCPKNSHWILRVETSPQQPRCHEKILEDACAELHLYGVSIGKGMITILYPPLPE